MARNRTAKNYTAYEAAKIIIEGKDFEAITDIFKRFPVFGMTCIKMNEASLDILKALGEFTARKMNAYMRSVLGIDEGESDEDDDEEKSEVKPAKKSAKKTVVEDDDDDDEDEDEDDEEEEKPAKKRGRAAKNVKKSAKKSSKKVEEDDDDDFDFDDD